jgi:hypothetical protein
MAVRLSALRTRRTLLPSNIIIRCHISLCEGSTFSPKLQQPLDVTIRRTQSEEVTPCRLQQHADTARLAAVSEKCSLEHGAQLAGGRATDCSAVDDQELCLRVHVRTHVYGLLGCYAL